MAQKDKNSLSSEIVGKFKQNPGIYIGSVFILILVTVTFVGGDLIGRRAGGDDIVFGYYDGVPIALVPGNLFAQYQQQAAMNLQSQGINPYESYKDYFISWHMAFEEITKQTAIRQIVKRSNYSIPINIVDRAVLQSLEYQDNGRFSNALYQQMPETKRLAIWHRTHDELIKEMYTSDMLGLLKPSGEIDFIANMSTPQRSFQMVYFKVDDYPDSEILSYARENSRLFNSIHLSKITVSGEREAKKILASIKDGITTFEDAARTQSQDNFADRGGDMGKNYRVDLNVQILNPSDQEAIFNLRKGEFSDVIRSGDAWSFFRVEEELTPPNFEDEAVMARVRSYIRSVESGRMEDWTLAQADGFIADFKNAGIINAALWWNLEIYDFGPLPINYAGIELFTPLESFTIADFSSEYVQTISRNEDFWKIAFSTPLNTPSKPLVQGNNVLVFIPIEQTDNDESFIESIASMYSYYWLYSVTEQSMGTYFLNTDKMDDRFVKEFSRLIPTGD